MTVKMLTAWNGYPKDYIGSVISPSEEARLVGIGFASYDLDGVDNDNVRTPVTAVSNPLTGGISLMVGGKVYRQRQSSAAAIGDVALVTLSAAASVTRGLARRLDFEIGAIKARCYNSHTAAIAGCTASVAVVDGAADPYGTTATWTNLTFGGSSTYTQALGSGTSPAHTFGVNDSDIAYISGSSGQLLLARNFTPGANNSRFEHPTRSANLAADGLVMSYFLGDGITTPANYVPTYHNTGPAMHFIVYPKSSVRTWVATGASTTAGQGDDVTLGWVRRTEQLAQDGGLAVSTVNLGHSGSPTAPSLVRAIQAVNLFKPTYASWHPFTTNDAPGLTDIPRLRGQCLQFIDACAAVGSIPVLVTFQPNSVASGDALTVMQSINQYCRELTSAGSCLILDFQLLFSGSTTGTTWAVAGNTTDGTHPNAQGHAKAATYAYSVLF